MKRYYTLPFSAATLCEEHYPGLYIYTFKGKEFRCRKVRGKWLLTYEWANGGVDYWEFPTAVAARQWLRKELK